MAPNAQNDIGNTTNGDQAACMLLRNHFFFLIYKCLHKSVYSNLEHFEV